MEWMPIKGYEGKYEISNEGRIKSCEREVFQMGIGYRRLKEYMMKPWDNGNGYKVVSLLKDGKRKNFYVHRLVAEHFIPNPNGFKEVNHIDYDKNNNNVMNLEWTDRASNVRYSAEHMKHPKTKTHSNTGHYYISRKKGYDDLYVITVDKKAKYARSLEDALLIRNKMIEGRING